MSPDILSPMFPVAHHTTPPLVGERSQVPSKLLRRAGSPPFRVGEACRMITGRLIRFRTAKYQKYLRFLTKF